MICSICGECTDALINHQGEKCCQECLEYREDQESSQLNDERGLMEYYESEV